MASDINKTVLVGRLTRDMELKTTNTGFSIGNISLASSTNQKRGDNWEDYSNFFDCTLLGKRAEALAQYLVKGQQVAIEGKLKQERWETAEGQKRSRVSILIDNIQLLGGKPKTSTDSEFNDKDDIPF